MKIIYLDNAKTICSLIIILLLNCVYSCVKKVVPPEIPVKHNPIDIIDTNLGRISFILNDDTINNFHSTNEKINNKILIGGTKFEIQAGYLRPFQHLTICISERSLSRQKVFRRGNNDPYSDTTPTWARFNTAAADFDVGCEFFEVNEKDSINNFVQITKQLNNFSEIWGKFNISLIKKGNCEDSLYPYLIKLENGYFHCYIK